MTRRREPENMLSHLLPIAANLTLTYSGWLGGTLVYTHRAGVEEEWQDIVPLERREA